MKKSAPDRMLTAARQVRTRAHAPYSRFRVGAAVRDERGRIFVGCNVENASYGLTTCAERNAVVAAIAAGARRLRALTVVTAASPPAPPCGACLQVLAEFADGTLPITLAGPRGSAQRSFHLQDLLPNRFTLA